MNLYLRVFELASYEDLNVLEWFQQLKQSAWDTGQAAQSVAQIIKEVEAKGDRAVVRYMQQWSNPDFAIEDICVRPDVLDDALYRLDRSLRAAMETAISNVRAYQEHIKPVNPAPVTIGGANLGLRFRPVASVGLAVPGGMAAYPSTVIMLAVPALVAGVDVKSIQVVSPPPTRTKGKTMSEPKSSPLVLAACALLGIEKVYRIGGAQAMAALALGTQQVPSVDMIVGPGNIYTQIAKQQLNGRVGIDGFFGPSEILTIADDSADPACVAADLIAQAEHDPGRCFLVAWSHKVIGSINEQIERQLETRYRRKAIIASLAKWSAALLVRNKANAVKIANLIAAEHVSLAVRDPRPWVQLIHNGGEFFLGDHTPVAAGDYIAGPSHCLPTGTTARYASGVSVYTFLRRSGVIHYPGKVPQKCIDAAAQIATAEGLDGHAASMRIRNHE